MNKNITDNKCTGCLACENICPKGAISHNKNSGFIIPYVNDSICVNCSFCIKVCPQNEGIKSNTEFIQEAYSVKNLNPEILKKSTSGGVFFALAKNVINKGGVVYGCVTKGKEVKHIRAVSGILEMMGSKYVQSDLSLIYSDLANDIKNGKIILFTGTPCQCKAVKNFIKLRKLSSEKLILADFICHGTPSPKIFQDYIDYCEVKSKKKIEKHLFRSKVNGWTKHTEINCFTDGSKDSQSYCSQLFKSIFYSHLAMNTACFECRYTSIDRVSDITLADFWGIQKSHPELFDQNGISFVLINSSKGKLIIESCCNIEKHKVSVKDVDQPSLYQSAEKPEKYNQFWKDYQEKGFKYIVKKYYHGGIIYRLISDLFHAAFKGRKHES